MHKVLLIEDNEILLKIVKNLLDKNGFITEIATNGKDAIEMLDKDRYDLVVTDMMMPYANGMDVIRKLKSDDATKNTAIIVVSSTGNESKVTEAFNLGADDYIIKPFIASELLTRIRKLI